MATVEQWEYWTGFFWANIDDNGVREYTKKRWPNWNVPKFAPQTMMPKLNDYGKEGWELIHMEPVRAVGDNQDVLFQSGGDITKKDWSNVYFCVFKRKIISSE
jgi:hypothetical protein